MIQFLRHGRRRDVRLEILVVPITQPRITISLIPIAARCCCNVAYKQYTTIITSALQSRDTSNKEAINGNLIVRDLRSVQNDPETLASASVGNDYQYGL